MSKKILGALALTLASAMMTSSAMACTVYGIGKNATADGSTMVTHTCDSTSDDFRMWIIPEMEGGEGITADIVMNGNTWGDWSDYPNTKNYGSGMVMGEMPQPKDTFQYLHTNYSIINENGVAMGESTCGIDSTTEYGKKMNALMNDGNDGIIDCYQAQHVALRYATTAREAVEIMGALVDEYGWNAWPECINICDGNEVWIAEFYGRDLWCAVRVPDDAFFVCANRCRINEIDFEDNENYIWSKTLKPFAIENGLWSEDSGVPFQPANIYAPNYSMGCIRREWRALSLVAPSLNLDPHVDPQNAVYPMFVVPENKLSVEDVRKMNSDYYQGTEFDVSLSPEAGPYGNPLNEYNKERPINMYRATYHFIANIKADMPKEAKPLMWIGWGAPDSSYMIPLFATMTKLPPQLSTGSRYGKFDRDSAWWVSSYVQQTATQNYDSAIEEIYAARDPKMAEQYETVIAMQEAAAALSNAGKGDEAVKLLTEYAYNNAIDWHNYWLELGDELYGTYMFNRVDMKRAAYPDWWSEILNNAPRRPVEESAK